MDPALAQLVRQRAGDRGETLAEALQRHGQTHEVVRRRETPFGPRFEVQRTIAAPDGRQPCVSTIWPRKLWFDTSHRRRIA